jgi:Fe-S-cluster formation regulator IscX/YfhJ
LKPLKAYRTYEKYDISLFVSFEIIEQNITGYDNKFDDKNKKANEKVLQLLQHDNMHKFKDKIVQILQDNNMHK